jgi:chemotaxis protein CheD
MNEILIGIGEFKISKAPDVLKTNLGSCVGVFLYDSSTKIGGVLHILLPESNGRNDNLNKYADTGIDNMIAALEKKGADTKKLVAKIFGGAHVLELIKKEIGKENIDITKKKLKEYGIRIISEKTGGNKGCLIAASLSDGRVKFRAFGEVEKVF